MTLIAEAFVQLRPDARGFRGETSRKLREQLKGLAGNIKLAVDSSGLRAETSRAVKAAASGIKASVDVEADPSGLADTVRTAARNSKAKIEAEVDGRDLAERVREAARQAATDIEVNADLTGFDAELRAKLAAAAREKAAVKVVADATGLRGEVALAAAFAALGQDIDVPVKTNARAAAGGFDGLFDSISKNLLVGRAFGQALGLLKFPALVSGAAAAAGALSALGAGAVGATSALSPLAGLLGTVPGLLGGLVQGTGSAAFGLSGVADAVKALGEAERNAAEDASTAAERTEAGLLRREAAAERVRSSLRALTASQDVAIRSEEDGARRVETAERSLSGAQRDATSAQEALTRARQDAAERLEDLALANERGALTEERATLSAAEAQKRLREARFDPTAGALGVKSAELAVREAEQSLREVRERRADEATEFAEARRRGVEGSEEVADARKQVADADQQVIDSIRSVRDAYADASRQQQDSTDRVVEAQRDLAIAYRDAERASREALDEASSSAKKAQDALEALPPAARDFAHKLNDLRGPLRQLREESASNLLPGLTSALDRTTVLFPLLKTAIGDTSAEIGTFADRFAELITSGPFRADLASIARNNVRSIRRFGIAGLDLTSALKDITVAADPLVERLETMAIRFGKSASEATALGRQRGTLEGFFTRSADVLEQVSRIGGNVFGLLRNIGQEAAPLGQSLLDAFEKGTAGLETLTDTAQGRSALRDFFEGSREPLREIGALIRDVGEGFVEVAGSSDIASIVSQLRTELLPVLVDLASKASESFTPALITLISEGVRLFGTLAGQSGGLTIFVEALGTLLGVVNDLIEKTPGLDAAVGSFLALGGALGALKTAGLVASGLAKFAGALVGVKAAAGAAGGAGAVGAVGGLASAFTLANTKALVAKAGVAAVVLEVLNIATAVPKADAAARQLADRLTGDAFESNNLTYVTKQAEGLGKELQKQTDIHRSFGGSWARTIRGAIEVLSPLPNKVIDTSRAVKALAERSDDLGIVMDDLTPNIVGVAAATGLTSDEVHKLAVQLGVDFSAPFAESAGKVVEEFGKIAKAAGFSSENQARASGLSLKALTDQATEVEGLRGSMESSFASQTNIVEAFAGKATVSKEEVVRFFSEQVTAARTWAADLKELAGTGVDQGLIQVLAEAGPKAAPLVQGLLDQVRTGGVGVINQGRADLKTILDDTRDDIVGRYAESKVAGTGLGQAIGSGAVEGLAANRPSMSEEAERIAGQVRAAIPKADEAGKDVGTSIFEGIRKGVQERATSHPIVAVVNGTIDGIAGFFRDKLEARSPSRLFAREVGAPIPEGIAKGLADAAPAIRPPSEALIADLQRQFAGRTIGFDSPEVARLATSIDVSDILRTDPNFTAPADGAAGSALSGLSEVLALLPTVTRQSGASFQELTQAMALGQVTVAQTTRVRQQETQEIALLVSELRTLVEVLRAAGLTAGPLVGQLTVTAEQSKLAGTVVSRLREAEHLFR